MGPYGMILCIHPIFAPLKINTVENTYISEVEEENILLCVKQEILLVFFLIISIQSISEAQPFSNFSCMFLNPNIFFQFEF